MLDGLRRLREVEHLSPHGIRLPWCPEPIWTRIVADTPIAPACFSIPVAPATFVSSIATALALWHRMPRALGLPWLRQPLGQGTGLGLSQVFGFTQPSGGSAGFGLAPGLAGAG